MLEGKELEGNIGAHGKYSVDLDSQGNIEIAVGAKINIVDELEKAAAKTGTPIDDAAIKWIKELLAKLG